MLKRLLVLSLLVVSLVISVTGCHTVRGAGEDIESVGDAVQDATK